MLSLLREIADSGDNDDTWVGKKTIRELRETLSGMKKDAPPLDRSVVHFRLGKEELRHGNEREAIAQLMKARELTLVDNGELSLQARRFVAFELGVAHLRVGETENCCLRNTPESCILPIRGGGIHTKPEGSKLATTFLLEVLRDSSQGSMAYLKSRWLLNIAYMTLGGYPNSVPERYRIAENVFRSAPFPRFANIAARLGLDTFDLCGGAVVDDFDNDGYLDILTSTYDLAGQMKFFRNSRDGKFTDRTAESGLLGEYGGLNMVQADYDNDGNLDVLVLRGAWKAEFGRHPNSLLRGYGDGTFTDVTFEAGLAEVDYPTQTGAWADYDNDGDLDLYVGNENMKDLRCPCQLFRNNGDGTFTDVAPAAGVENFAFAKAVVWGHVGPDHLPYLYVSNHFSPNRLYRPNGDGTFTDVAERLGVTNPTRSFASWFWDYDNDGALDLYVAGYDWAPGVSSVSRVAASYAGQVLDGELARLYRGDGLGGFVEATLEPKLDLYTLPMGANFGDLDGDGYLDFYLGTGYPDYEALMPNVMYRNLGGTGFVDVTTSGGFGHLQKGHGVSFADLDNDGDQDVFIQMGGAYPGDKAGNVLYENPGFGSHWIAVQLVGVQSNRSAIGARIRVEITEKGKTRSVFKHVNSGGSFGASPLRQNIGLGGAEKIDQLEVFWPRTGKTQVFRGVPIDVFVRIVESEDKYTVVPLKRFEFADHKL